jgi:hypothetical protein
MKVDVLLAQLAAADVVLSVEGNKLLFDAPAGTLTPELRAALVVHRAELVRRLSAPGASTGAAPITAEPLAAQNSPAWGTKPVVNPLLVCPADRFADWILRPDVSGKLGWEAPDLPESSRWWARSTFDALPTWPQSNSPPNTNRLRLP